jgi:hypothetical protein
MIGRLIQTKLLPDFPSGSAINFFNDRLFLVGDDANHLVVLDMQYNAIDSLPLFHFPEKRISKKEKTDFEASAIIALQGVDHLLIVGSGAKKIRKRLFLLPISHSLPDLPHLQIIETSTFLDRVEKAGVSELNLEGVTTAAGNVILSNRGNQKNTTNHLIVTTPEFWMQQEGASIYLIALEVMAQKKDVPGVSDIHYDRSLDLLLLLLSSEATDNAYDDGAIGDSYIGIVRHFSTKMKSERIAMDEMICLTDAHPEFDKQKMEGVCVEKIDGSTLMLHMISDNDTGDTRLFKFELQI